MHSLEKEELETEEEEEEEEEEEVGTFFFFCISYLVWAFVALSKNEKTKSLHHLTAAEWIE